MIDDTDPRFQLIDALADGPAPGTTKRAGFAARIRVDRPTMSGDLTTTPTVNSAAVVALAVFAPHQFSMLWNHVEATIKLGGVSTDVLVYFEQGRLSPAGPALKVWLTNVMADSLDVSGFAITPDVFLAEIITLALNEVLDHVTPALLDRTRQELFAFLDRLQAFIDETVAGAFGTTPTPRAPRTATSIQQRIQDAVSRGLSLTDDLRLQRMLNLDREQLFERRTGDVDDAQRRFDAAAGTLGARWEEHRQAAEDARVPCLPQGSTPPSPIRSTAGAVLSDAQIDRLQTTFDAWAEQRRVVAAAEEELREASEALQTLLDDRPEWHSACEVMGEPDGYRVGLALCRSGGERRGSGARVPVGRVWQTGDLTLLLSTRAFREMLDGTVFAYRGDVRHTDGSPGVLAQLPAVDWWADGPNPAAGPTARGSARRTAGDRPRPIGQPGRRLAGVLERDRRQRPIGAAAAGAQPHADRPRRGNPRRRDRAGRRRYVHARHDGAVRPRSHPARRRSAAAAGGGPLPPADRTERAPSPTRPSHHARR